MVWLESSKEIEPLTESTKLNLHSEQKTERKLNSKDWLKIFILCLDICCTGLGSSIITSFFPIYAKSKGLNLTEVGIIVSTFSIAVIVSSPILPYFIKKIGRRILLIVSLLILAVSQLPFAYAMMLENRFLFLTTCLVCRFGIGVAYVICQISVFSIATTEYSANMTFVLGLLEMGLSIGISIGPAIGGILYDILGFKGPFFSLLGIALFSSLMTFVFLKLDSQRREDLAEVNDIHECQNKSKTMNYKTFFQFPLLLLPVVSGTIIFFNNVSLNIILPPYLNENYAMKPSSIGFIFLIAVGIYSVLSPFIGYIIDRKHNHGSMLITGYLLTGLALLFTGPIPFFDKKLHGWKYVILTSIVYIGTALMYVPIIGMCIKIAKSYNIEDSNATKNVITSFFVFTGNLGLLIGSLLCGFLSNDFGFKTTMLVLGSLTLSVGTISGALLLKNSCNKDS